MKTILVLLAVLSIAFAQSTYQLNLTRSINRIQNQIEVTKLKPAQWDKLDKIIDDALDCISGLNLGIVSVNDAKWMSPTLVNYVESISYGSLARMLQDVDWAAVQSKGSSANRQAALDDLKEFMKTPAFKTIHTHIFGNVEFLDMLKFLHSASYTQIYDAIRLFYEAMGQSDRTELPLPTGPDWIPSTYTVETRQFPQNGGNRLPDIKFSPPTILQKCSLEGGLDGLSPLWDVLNRLNASNIHEVIKVLLYMLQEVIGNSAMHILLLKFGEPHKGQFFDEILTLPEMREGIVYVHELVLSEPGIAQLNEILKQVTGLDLANQELFVYIVNLVKYLVWNHPFPTA